jgi:hypothetical protein
MLGVGAILPIEFLKLKASCKAIINLNTDYSDFSDRHSNYSFLERTVCRIKSVLSNIAAL